MRSPSVPCTLPLALLLGLTLAAQAADVTVDLSGFRAPKEDSVRVRHEGERLDLTWPASSDQVARLVLDLHPGAPLIQSVGLVSDASKEPATLKGVDPEWFLTVGTRESPRGRPPEMSVFNVFFDSPAKRPFQKYRSTLDLKTARVEGTADRASVSLGAFSAGPFSGELRFTVYAGSALVRIEAAMSTKGEKTAFVYDAGLVAKAPNWSDVAWHDTEGRLQKSPFPAQAEARAVRHRAIAVETPGGSVVAFPPPHQYFYPRDLTDNQKTVWSGRGYRGEDRPGFGIRQTETGGGNFVPWFNAPPGTEQHMGMFLLLHDGPAASALEEGLRFTHGDRFPDLPGRVTFTSHWHMAVALAAMKEIAEGKPRSTPDFVKMFKDMNVEMVHLAEFHGDGHPQDPGPLRLAEMKAMFEECKRLSDEDLTFFPGEEANVHLRVRKPEASAGHWLYFFPKPVYWTMKRAPGQPFVEDDPKLGRIYHTGNQDDLLRLLEAEHGLAWTAHPRIKASSWAPDAYRDQPYYVSDRWLGGAWKAMPADLSQPRLGSRVLNLLDDMANWGPRKYAPGEVDVFKIDHTHELYGHMNINYLKLDHAPAFEDDWSPVLDALRRGKFFVTTGEVLLPHFTVQGKESGETITLAADGSAEAVLELRWTFPLAFIEFLSGDGEHVYRERLPRAQTRAFGKERLTHKLALKGRTWVRVEAWDVAGDGAFSQPVWIEGAR